MTDDAPKILLVEDDPEQTLLFAQVLELSGYAVVTVDDAEQAQARLIAEAFALLLADWDLPSEMQGNMLITWAKTQSPGIKAILFSNHPYVDEAAASCGADAAFRKTEGIARLRQLVANLLPATTNHP